MAEGLFKQVLINSKKDGLIISSAGLGALVGHPPDTKACELMMRKNIDISNYRACQLNKDMIRKADLILVMELSHKRAIEEFEPYAKGKVFLLGHWGKFDIPDPYQQNLSVFETSFNLIERGVFEWVEKL